MSWNGLELIDVVIVASMFGLVLSLWYLGVAIWVRRREAQEHRVEQRLGVSGQDGAGGNVLRLWHDGKETTIRVARQGGRRGLTDRLTRLRDDAGLERDLPTLFLIVVGTAAATAFGAFVWTGTIVATIAAGVATIAGFNLYVNHLISQRSARFETQLVDALELAARSLRAGHPLFGAFQLIADEIGPPVGKVFSEICQQQDLGLSQEEAIKYTAKKSTSDDVKLFATSIGIQLRSGGNLADMMGRLAEVIRDRIRVSRKVRVLTSQAQLSKRVLSGLPFVMFIILNILDPDYLEPLYFTTQGQFLLAAAGVGLLLGMWSMGRLIKLDY